MNVDLAASFMNASRIGIFWFYTSEGPYPSRVLPTACVMPDDQSIQSELLPRLNPRIDNPHHGDYKGNKFRRKDELYPEGQELEMHSQNAQSWENLFSVRFQNQSTGLKYELDSLINTNCHS